MGAVASPIIYNLTLTNANTEYSQLLRSFSKMFLIQCRSIADMRLAFVATETATNYITIFSGSSYAFEVADGFVGEKTVYLRSASAGVVAEILTWA